MIFSSVVPAGTEKNTALPDYLARRFTYHGRDEWAGIIGAGKITVNGRAARAGDMPAPGDVVAYDAGEFEEPAADLAYRICYEDEWIIGVDKPGNLLVHRAGRSVRNNCIYQLRHVHAPPYPEAHAVHRLDRETSGVLCVVKTASVRAALARQFAEGKVDKKYVAVVRGMPQTGTIALPIGKPIFSGVSCMHGVMAGGKPAMTEIIERRPLGAEHALVTARPLTGRTHQIRVHLAVAGAPIVGVRLYGVERGVFPRQALHCASLSFVHPVTGKTCRMEAPLPADLHALIERLSGETMRGD